MIKAILGIIWLKAVLGILWLVLLILALVDILGSVKKSAGIKFLWIIVCLILPLIGVLAYFLFGRDEENKIYPQQ
ncbi:MAG: PLDc N-terminal domain-containing protein [Patescibacteria group bacterium]